MENSENIDFIEYWEELKSENEETQIALGILCIQKSEDPKILEEYLKIVNDSKSLTIFQKLYLLNQVSAIAFRVSNLKQTYYTKKLEYLMYHNIYERFEEKIKGIKWIDVNERNETLIIVTSQQILNLNHGPTKTTLDRAKILKDNLKKKVIIINTAEQMGGDAVPIATGFNSNYDINLSNAEYLDYENDRFPYIQFDNNTPNVEMGQILVDFILKNKPAYIVNIGGGSLMADVCAKLVPVLNINTVPSDITRTHATAQAVGKKNISDIRELLEILGKKTESIIIGRFTSSLKEQQLLLTKKDLGFPENCFIIVVVGGRLTHELDNNFVQMMEPILKQNAHLVIIGEMNTYDKMCNENIVFKKNSSYLGLQNDVLAILDNVDLYVNPDRTGGGTSVIEAMYKAIPVVTLDHGDVALGAGEDFCVKSYSEMQDKIFDYMNDLVYYNEMSNKAKERADYMLDGVGAFTDIIREFETKFCNR